MAIQLDQAISSTSIEFQTIAGELQGNILNSHGRKHAAHIFLKFNNIAKAKKVIRGIISPRVTTAHKQKEDSKAKDLTPHSKYRYFLNFSLSKAGYDFLEIDEVNIPDDASFSLGAKQQTGKLNDPAINAWENAYQTDWHAVLVAANASRSHLDNQVDFLLGKLKPAQSHCYVEYGMGIKNSAGHPIEHFGYVDGISQPHFLTDKIDDEVLTSDWDPETPLNNVLVKDKGGGANSFGSYFVFRKLEQSVLAFNNAVVELAEKLQITPEYAGAQIVGRFKDGTPLTLFSEPQNIQDRDEHRKIMNNFDFANDNTMGSGCPFHAHIRKANPRGTGGFETAEEERKHLFARRGITYGDRDEVGLLFMAYNNNISDQFEFMQALWANATNFPGGKPNGPHGIDPLIGQGDLASGQNYFKKWKDDNDSQRIVPSFGEFVTMKGGEYFFTPSLSFLKSL